MFSVASVLFRPVLTHCKCSLFVVGWINKCLCSDGCLSFIHFNKLYRDSKLLTIQMITPAEGYSFVMDTEILEGGKVYLFTFSAFVHKSFFKVQSLCYLQRTLSSQVLLPAKLDREFSFQLSSVLSPGDRRLPDGTTSDECHKTVAGLSFSIDIHPLGDVIQLYGFMYLLSTIPQFISSPAFPSNARLCLFNITKCVILNWTPSPPPRTCSTCSISHFQLMVTSLPSRSDRTVPHDFGSCQSHTQLPSPPGNHDSSTITTCPESKCFLWYLLDLTLHYLLPILLQ